LSYGYWADRQEEEDIYSIWKLWSLQYSKIKILLRCSDVLLFSFIAQMKTNKLEQTFETI